MTTALLVALGAAVGAAGRHLTNHWLRERFGATPAGGTLAVNLLGSFVLGVLAGAAVDGGWLALLGIGFCGAYTTFSTLALELWSAFEDGRRRARGRRLSRRLPCPRGRSSPTQRSASRSVSPRHTWGSGSPPERRRPRFPSLWQRKTADVRVERVERELSAAHGVQRVDDAVTVEAVELRCPRADRGGRRCTTNLGVALDPTHW